MQLIYQDLTKLFEIDMLQLTMTTVYEGHPLSFQREN